MGGLTIEIIFYILKIEKRNKIIVFDFQKVGAGAQKSGGAAALPAPPPPRSLNALVQMPKFCIIIVFDLPWVDRNSQEKLEKNGYAKFLGVNKVHYGLCHNGEYS